MFVASLTAFFASADAFCADGSGITSTNLTFFTDITAAKSVVDDPIAIVVDLVVADLLGGKDFAITWTPRAVD